MTGDHDALLAGVLADPDADLPRLVYADFLDDAGDAADVARAEFIRVQCELAADPPPDLQRQLALRIRERLLRDAHAKAWLAPLRVKGEALQNPGTHGQFRRGFVEMVWMPAPVFTAKAAKLFARAPVNEPRVTRTSENALHELLTQPLAARLRTLDLSDRQLGNAAAWSLVNSPALLGLRSVLLRACGLTAGAVEYLLSAPAAWRPDRLDLSLNDIPPADFAALRDRYGDALRGP